MVCPECGSEYRDGYSNCADCGVALVEPEPEVDPGEPDAELVQVFQGGNAAILPLIESMLHDANIEFLVKGEVLQDLFGIGRMGMGSNNMIGPVEIWVRKDAEAEARALIEVLEAPVEGAGGEGE